MKKLTTSVLSILLLVCFATAVGFGRLESSQDKEVGASIPAQAAADALRSFAGTDGAFLAAGLIKDGYQKSADLSTLLLYPEDEVVVVRLTGAQLKQAFERSVSLYPQPNTSFLQLSGFEVTFSKGASTGKRVTSATVGGAAIDNAKTYDVAMPSSLGKGGLGYFKIWDKPNIVKTFDKATVESVLKGKPYADSAPRWSAAP